MVGKSGVEGLDRGQLVQLGPPRRVPAIDAPGEDEQPAAHDDESGPEADTRPDRIEDHDSEDAEEEEDDRGTGELESGPHDRASLGRPVARRKPGAVGRNAS